MASLPKGLRVTLKHSGRKGWLTGGHYALGFQDRYAFTWIAESYSVALSPGGPGVHQHVDDFTVDDCEENRALLR